MEAFVALLKEGWFFALLAVAITETVMRATKSIVKITRRKYAPILTIIIAILASWLWTFKTVEAPQIQVSQLDGLFRGLGAAILATFGYNVIKSTLVNLPFIKNVN